MGRPISDYDAFWIQEMRRRRKKQDAGKPIDEEALLEGFQMMRGDYDDGPEEADVETIF